MAVRFPRSIVAYLVCLALSSTLMASEKLAYRFANIKEPTYLVTLTGELPESVETHSGHIAYNIQQVDQANGQVQFGYSVAMNAQTTKPQPNQRPQIPPPAFPPGFGAPAPAAPQIVIDSLGNV